MKWRRGKKILTKTGEKVALQVLIPYKLYEKVLRVAVEVYGVQRGALSMAVTEALEMWLAAHTHQHTRTNPRLPLRERYNAVMECVRAEVGTIPITIHQLFLEKCISNTFNVKDMRTVYGWLHRFYMAGLIKPLTVKVSKPSDWARNKAVELVARSA